MKNWKNLKKIFFALQNDSDEPILDFDNATTDITTTAAAATSAVAATITTTTAKTEASYSTNLGFPTSGSTISMMSVLSDSLVIDSTTVVGISVKPALKNIDLPF